MTDPTAVVPAPLPLSTPITPQAPKRRRWIAWVVGCVVLLVLAACIITVTLGAKLARTIVDQGNTGFVSPNALAVFSADGSWAVCQSSDSTGVTKLTAVRPSDGASSSLDGYALVAVEPSGSRFRIMRAPDTAPFALIANASDASATAAALDGLMVSPGSYVDLPGLTTYVWDPSGGATPSVAAWADDIRDSSHSVTFRTGAAGAYPAEMSFRVAGRTFTVTSTATLQPIGWSPSARFYAAVELPSAIGLSQEGEGSRTVRLRVWDTRSASEVASRTVALGLGTRFVWSPGVDALYWSAFGADQAPPERVWCLTPDHGAKSVAMPSSDGSGTPVVIGVDRSGVLVRDLHSADASTTATPGARRYAHLRILPSGRVERAGSDTLRALYGESRGSGVLYWMPAFPPEDDTSLAGALGASGISVWHAASFDATPTILFNARY